MSNSSSANNLKFDLNSRAAIRYRRWRSVKDVCTHYVMAIGGISVILAIVLIAFYLFYVVMPMFSPAHLEQHASYSLPGNADSDTLLYQMEEQREVGMRLDSDGQLVFFSH